MRTNLPIRIHRILVVSALLTALSVCGCGTSDDDRCLDTVAPQVHVDVTYVVQTWYQVYEEPRGELPGCIVDITTRKLLCEGGSKGLFEFPNSYTASPNKYQFTVGYNLQNKLDKIELRASSVPGEPPWPDDLSSIAHTSVSDYISYAQAEAAGGSMTRIVDIVHVAGRTTH